MTVCLAALCAENGEPRVVFASDRMVQWGGIVEFEHTEPKVTAASAHAVMMISGDALVGTMLARDTAGALAGTDTPVANIVTTLVQRYQAHRQAEVEQVFLRPRGLDFGTYYGRQAGLNGNVVAVIDQAMTNFDPGAEFLVAGIDSSGAHIYTVGNPGMSRLHDVIGFAAIGSGMLHALQSMIGYQHSVSAPLAETVFRVYASKRRAEVAPGVGTDTDMGLATPAGMRWLTADELASLREMYEEHEATTSNALAARLSNFAFDQPTEPTVSSIEVDERGGDHESRGDHGQPESAE